MSNPTKAAPEANWFTELCGKHGLVPAGPKLARDIVAGDVLFDPLGGPKPVKSVRLGTKSITINFDGYQPSDTWPLDVTFTLIAEKAAP